MNKYNTTCDKLKANAKIYTKPVYNEKISENQMWYCDESTDF